MELEAEDKLSDLIVKCNSSKVAADKDSAKLSKLVFLIFELC